MILSGKICTVYFWDRKTQFRRSITRQFKFLISICSLICYKIATLSYKSSGQFYQYVQGCNSSRKHEPKHFPISIIMGQLFRPSNKSFCIVYAQFLYAFVYKLDLFI